MKAYVLFSSKEPVLIVTRETIRSEAVLDQLGRVGINKFIAREVPASRLRIRYGRQFDVIEEALQKGSELRVLDFSGHRIFQNLPFSELGSGYRHESGPAIADSSQTSSRAAFRPNLGSASPAGLG
jgi:hypothetical protein